MDKIFDLGNKKEYKTKQYNVLNSDNETIYTCYAGNIDDALEEIKENVTLTDDCMIEESTMLMIPLKRT